MGDGGLVEVPNPSEMLLAGRPLDAPGTCVTCVMEGVRPVLAEVQALLAPTSFNVPRAPPTALTSTGSTCFWQCWRSGAACW